MEYETNLRLLTIRDINRIFNMGLQSAVSVLEMSEKLSPEGRKYLLELLKKNISENEQVDTAQLIERISYK